MITPMRFCECGCFECWEQTGEHDPCLLECEVDVAPRVPAHGREIIVIDHA